MASLCNKCKNLWQRLGKSYCIHGACGGNCKYSKSKKQCPYFEEGKNIKQYLSKTNGWWKKKNG